MASKARNIARGILPASSAARASFNISPGVAPTTPQEGDMWRVGSQVFIHTSGTTVNLSGLVDEAKVKSIAKKAATVFG